MLPHDIKEFYAGHKPWYATFTPQPFTANPKAQAMIDHYVAATGVKVRHVRWGENPQPHHMDAAWLYQVEEWGAVESYDWMTDNATVGFPEFYVHPDWYYKALFHELMHSTSHEKRLGLIQSCMDYSWEELRAERATLDLAKQAGLTNPDVYEFIDIYTQRWEMKRHSNWFVLTSAKVPVAESVDYFLNPKEKGESSRI
jgi:hypothetical protein